MADNRVIYQPQTINKVNDNFKPALLFLYNMQKSMNNFDTLSYGN